MLLKAHLFDTVIIVDYKGIPFALVLRALTSKIVVAEKAAFQLLLRGALPVFARSPSTVQAH